MPIAWNGARIHPSIAARSLLPPPMLADRANASPSGVYHGEAGFSVWALAYWPVRSELGV